MNIDKPLRLVIHPIYIDELRRWMYPQQKIDGIPYREADGSSNKADPRVTMPWHSILDIYFGNYMPESRIVIRHAKTDEKVFRWLMRGIEEGINEYDALSFSEQHTQPRLRERQEDGSEYYVAFLSPPDAREYQIPLLYRFTIDEAKDCLIYTKRQEDTILRQILSGCFTIKLDGKDYVLYSRWDFLSFCKALKTAIDFYEKDPRYVNGMMIAYKSSLGPFDKLVFHCRRLLRLLSPK